MRFPECIGINEESTGCDHGNGRLARKGRERRIDKRDESNHGLKKEAPAANTLPL